MVPDVWTGNAPRSGFPGAKPEGFTRWILDCLSYDPFVDAVWDVFRGSGAVTGAVITYARERGAEVSSDANGVVNLLGSC